MQQEIKTQQKEEYKKTELGLLPESWDVVKLKVIGKIITGNTPPKKNKEYWQNGEIDFIKPPDLRNRLIKTFSERISKNAEKRARIVGKDSILISCIGIIGRVGYSAKKIAFNQQINAIEAYENIDNLFLFYVLQNEQQQIENLASFTTVPIVSKAKFSEVQIPFPYLPEQKKIAYVLSAIQTAKEKTEAVVNSLKELKKSMMKHLFTYGVVSLKDAKNVKLKETEIGAVPEDWEVKDIDDVADYINGYAFKPNQWKRQGLPIIRIQNLTKTTGKINYFDGQIDEKYKIKDDDLLISWSASLGIFRWKQRDAWLNQHIFKVDNYSPKIFKDYFYYVVMTQLDFMKSKTRGSTMKHITRKEFLRIKIPIPSLSIQQKIASILSTIDIKIQKEENKKQALEDLFKSMLYNLMSAKIRVNDMVIKNV